MCKSWRILYKAVCQLIKMNKMVDQDGRFSTYTTSNNIHNGSQQNKKLLNTLGYMQLKE